MRLSAAAPAPSAVQAVVLDDELECPLLIPDGHAPFGVDLLREHLGRGLMHDVGDRPGRFHVEADDDRVVVRAAAPGRRRAETEHDGIRTATYRQGTAPPPMLTSGENEDHEAPRAAYDRVVEVRNRDEAEPLHDEGRLDHARDAPGLRHRAWCRSCRSRRPSSAPGQATKRHQPPGVRGDLLPARGGRPDEDDGRRPQWPGDAVLVPAGARHTLRAGGAERGCSAAARRRTGTTTCTANDFA